MLGIKSEPGTHHIVWSFDKDLHPAGVGRVVVPDAEKGKTSDLIRQKAFSINLETAHYESRQLSNSEVKQLGFELLKQSLVDSAMLYATAVERLDHDLGHIVGRLATAQHSGYGVDGL